MTIGRDRRTKNDWKLGARFLGGVSFLVILFFFVLFSFVHAQNSADEATRGEPELGDIERFSEETERRKTEENNDFLLLDRPYDTKNDRFTEKTGEERFETDTLILGLEPYMTLFSEYPATADWTGEVKKLVQITLAEMKENPASARVALAELAKKIIREDTLTESLLSLESPPTAASLPAAAKTVGAEFKPMLAQPAEKYAGAQFAGSPASEMSRTVRNLADYSPTERLEMFHAFRYQLDRRVYLWSFAADCYAADNAGELVPAKEPELPEIKSLRLKTEAVRDYFGVSRVGKQWRTAFEVDALLDTLQKIEERMTRPTLFKPVRSQGDGDAPPEEPFDVDTLKEETARLRDHINSICYKIRTTSMTGAQKKIFDDPVLSGWYGEMAEFGCDQTEPDELLHLFELYEKKGGGDTGRELARVAYRMKSSRSEVCRRLGSALSVIFNNPNIKVYISELFINRFLPIRDPEFDVVQETILNNPVAGRRRTETEVKIELVPDPERLLLNLVVDGSVVAATRSNVFPAKLFNESQAAYRGLKRLEWKDDGIRWSESQVAVNSSNQLSGVETDIDFVPVLGDIARELVRGQYQSRQEEIRQETTRKITQEVKNRIDTETKERFEAVNERLTGKFFEPLHSIGLSLAMQNSRTTDDWLLASLRLSEPGSLGSQTPEPPTVSGAYADLKIHDSAVNTALSRLELGGKVFTASELLSYLAARIKRPELADQTVNDGGLVFGMAQKDPVSIAFFENRIQIRLAFDFIEMGDQSWENIETTISYQPSFDDEGNAYLTRDGLISLDGPLSIRAQIPLRLIFGKMFPSQGHFPLKPKLFRDDERFAGLSIGLCRITEGWFAVSVIQPQTGK